MAYRYDDLASKSVPDLIDMPEALAEDVKYVFSVTYTDPDAICVEDFAKSTANAIKREGLDIATYPPPQGHEYLRCFIAEELSKNRAAEISPANIFLSSGAGGACQTIIDAFIDSGDVVMLDEFCYHGSLNMFLRKGASPVHVPMDDKGIVPDLLEEEIRKKISEGTKPKLIYTISVYHNPTGVTIPLDRRLKILDISNRYGIPIVENESYADFRIDGPELPDAMIGLDDEDGTFYISAFTKLMGCGLRLGFGVFPEGAREALEKVAFGTAPSSLTSMAVYEYLRENKQSYVDGVRESLREKRNAMLTALGEYFPPSCKWTAPNGGMMIWVDLPDHADTWHLLDKAVDAGVKYNPGPIFRSDRSGRNRLRLTYSHNSPAEINEGIEKLATLFGKNGVFEI